jgi:hypothetical protein
MTSSLYIGLIKLDLLIHYSFSFERCFITFSAVNPETTIMKYNINLKIINLKRYNIIFKLYNNSNKFILLNYNMYNKS